MMDDEVVKRRQWLSREQLLDLLGVTNLIPGPNSTELAIHIGYESWMAWTHHRWLMLHSARHAHRLDAGSRLRPLPDAGSVAAVWHQARDYRHRGTGIVAVGLESCQGYSHHCGGVAVIVAFPECG